MSPVEIPRKYSHGTAASTHWALRTYGGTKAELNLIPLPLDYFVAGCPDQINALVIQVDVVDIIERYSAFGNFKHAIVIKLQRGRLNAAQDFPTVYAKPGRVEIVQLEGIAFVEKEKPPHIWGGHQQTVK
jgi:hypothetical protein